MKERICKLCGKQFTPKSGRQFYCKEEHTAICPICGDSFTILCQPWNNTTCNKPECKKKAGYIGSISKKKICAICGREFIGTSSTQQYCNLPVTRICECCGKEFTINCTGEAYKQKTCSVECMNKLACINRQKSFMNSHTAICRFCGKEFHPRTNTQTVCDDKHIRTCSVCGKEFEIGYTHSTNTADLRITCSKECQYHALYTNNPFKDPVAREKAKQTCLMKYGVDHPMKSPEIKDKLFSAYKQKTGYDHPAHNPNTLVGKNLKVSSIEKKLQTALINNHIEFETQKQVNKGNAHHKFDFYLPKYKMYVDVDGVYYHGYLSDSNGNQVSEDRDDKRLMLIDPDEVFIVLSEANLNNGIKNLIAQLRLLDANMFNYDEYMFNWCRSIDFPYPIYTEERLKGDFNSLCNYSEIKYNSYAKMSISTIRHFHKSIYDAKVGNYPSIREAWDNDDILKKVIQNRMIYQNDIDPSKILAGFYISKIVPKVSIFNPVLARYLTIKYLSEFNTVVDPFSGFSGRLLGVCSTGKKYLGSDLNENAVKEANEIIKFHQLNAIVCERDILDVYDQPVYCDCLLTCPPYFRKESYSDETEYKTCDEWIELILDNFKCKRYVFVVDTVSEFKENIVEDIVTKSYFNNITEHVVVIDE